MSGLRGLRGLLGMRELIAWAIQMNVFVDDSQERERAELLLAEIDGAEVTK